MNFTIIAGLIIDILGAIFIVRAIIFTKSETVALYSGAHFDFNIRLVASFIKEKIEAIQGMALLCFGFLMQIIGNLGYDIGIQFCVLIFAALCAVILIFEREKKFLVRKFALRSVNIEKRNEYARSLTAKALDEFLGLRK